MEAEARSVWVAAALYPADLSQVPGNPIVTLIPSHFSRGPPVLPFYPFVGEGCPTKIDYRKIRVATYSNLSNLEDLVAHPQKLPGGDSTRSWARRRRQTYAPGTLQGWVKIGFMLRLDADQRHGPST